MSFLHPGFLWLGALAAAGIAVLHFIVTRQPKSGIFPTARFVPESRVEAVSRANRPSDLLLLFLRILAVMSIASAFARPTIASEREPKVRIILADLSRSSGSLHEVADSVSRYFRERDILIGFDSVPRLLVRPESLARIRPVTDHAKLSPALIQAIRTGSRLRDQADSISLVIISAFPASSWDAATDTIRSLWPGAINVVRVSARRDTAPRETPVLSGNFAESDPLRFSGALASIGGEVGSVRIIRTGVLQQADGVSGVLLHWPTSERPAFARQTKSIAHGSLIAGNAVVVAPFVTSFEFPADSVRDARILARWEDGTPAAIQRSAANGCVRSTNIPVSSKGDLVIRPEFVSIVRELFRPCTPATKFAPASEAHLIRLKGGSAAARRTAFPASTSPASRLPFWLFLAGVAFLVAEQILRHRAKNEEVRPEESIRVAA